MKLRKYIKKISALNEHSDDYVELMREETIQYKTLCGWRDIPIEYDHTYIESKFKVTERGKR